MYVTVSHNGLFHNFLSKVLSKDTSATSEASNKCAEANALANLSFDKTKAEKYYGLKTCNMQNISNLDLYSTRMKALSRQ